MSEGIVLLGEPMRSGTNKKGSFGREAGEKKVVLGTTLRSMDLFTRLSGPVPVPEELIRSPLFGFPSLPEIVNDIPWFGGVDCQH